MTETVLPQTILVVDDTPENIDVVTGALRHDYRVRAALSGERALVIAASEPRPDIILLDVMMPVMDGYEVLRRLKDNPLTQQTPVIFVTALSDQVDEQKGLQLGAVDYISKPISPAILQARVKTHLSLHQQNRDLTLKVKERTEELVRIRTEIIRRLGRAAEFRDNETGLHVIRMSHYARLIARAMGLGEEWSELLFLSAPMHDVGKIGIPDGVLLKSAKLDPEEWVIMRRHPIIGAEIMGEDPSELMRMSREIALAHHEKWDGSGYPRGLAGSDIPLSARIVAVADVFDALTTARPYKAAWSVEDAVALVKTASGSHFEKATVEAFLAVLKDILAVMETYQEDKSLAFRQLD
ncbi:MAG TPA: two-component system response regulator [Rhodospirillaceae bacterium]|nr:two-component system response regulator [Rhodospirillaceae bacterium]